MAFSTLPILLSLLWPVPRQVEPGPALKLCLPVAIEAPAALAGPASLLERELTRLFGPGAVGPGGKTRIRIALAPQDLPRAEEYAIETQETSVSLRAHDAQGAFWAVHSLVQILGSARPDGDGYLALGAKVRDWPESPFRAFMIQGAWGGTPDEIKRNFDLMARMKIAYFAHEFGPQVVLDMDPDMARGTRLTKAQAKEIIDYGRSLGMKPIAYLNLLGHLERAYRKAPYTDHGGILIQNDESYEKFVYPILTEMLEVYGPVEYSHCGMDEAWDLFAWYSEQGLDSADLIVRHITKVNDFLKARGVKLVIWHDMLVAPDLKEKLGGPVGPANGGPSRNTARALAALPKDVILNYWFYDPLEKYPALDYLRDQGFTVWASPWQTPFGLTRYAQARGVPTMGTLWSGPPGCLYSQTYSPVTALYAQAAWNPSVAPPGRNPEPEIAAKAQAATSSELWTRRSRVFPGTQALILSPGAPREPVRISWPKEGRKAGEILGGVPFSFAKPAIFPPLPGRGRALDAAAGAAYVLLPGGEKLVLDGVNTNRGANQLVLYAAPQTSTGTNIYGAEVAVSATGEVLAVTNYGAGDLAIPAGGFVLSAHLGNRAAKARRLLNLRPGKLVTVCDAEGNWLGGHEPASLTLALPDGSPLALTGTDRTRGNEDVILYQPGYGGGRTGANNHGVEVVVRGGKVAEVQQGAGDAAIPEDGWVVSAHQAGASAGATALEKLKPGDPLGLRMSKGGKAVDLGKALSERGCRLPVGEKCGTLFMALATEISTSPGTLLVTCVVRYADDQETRIPFRYARQVLPMDGRELPHTLDGSAWLAERRGTPARSLVLEWPNPRPDAPVESIRFEPAPHALEVGYRVLAVTGACR